MAARLAFEAIEGELTVELADDIDAAAFVAACDLLLPGWPRKTAQAEMVADLSVVATAQGYEITAQSWPGGAAAAGDFNNLANALGGMMIDALLARDRALCCLHAASVVFAGGALLFVGRSQAGKSTLALRFAARGHRIFGDDRVLVDTHRREAVALGLTSKARLPLPPGDDLEKFAKARGVLSDGGISYLHLSSAEQASFGSRLPISAIVLVERDADSKSPAAFSRLSAAPVAAGLIGEATSPGAADTVVESVTRLARAVGGYRLRFADGSRAVDAVLRDLAQPIGLAIT